MSQNAREALAALIAETKEAWADQRVTSDELLRIVHQAVDVAAHSKDPDAKAALVEVAESLFDQIVVPHNFPRIPDFLERMAESTLRSDIRPMVEGWYDLIVGVPHAA